MEVAIIIIVILLLVTFLYFYLSTLSDCAYSDPDTRDGLPMKDVTKEDL